MVKHPLHLFENALGIEYRNMIDDAFHGQRADEAHRAALHLQTALTA